MLLERKIFLLPAKKLWNIVGEKTCAMFQLTYNYNPIYDHETNPWNYRPGFVCRFMGKDSEYLQEYEIEEIEDSDIVALYK